MRILIVDDHELVREALQARLATLPGIEVVGAAEDGFSALEMVEKVAPEAVLLDYHMPDMDGGECARRIKEIHPECRILFLTGYPEEEQLLDAMHLVSGYVTKSASWSMLEQALEALANGKVFVDPNLLPTIMSRAAAADPSRRAIQSIDPQHLLTAMEGRVAVLAARGRANQQIAEELDISANTVKAHLQRAFRKLGVHAREDLATRLGQTPR